MESKKISVDITNEEFSRISIDYNENDFLMDKITPLELKEYIKTYFNYYLVAICKNGGLIAMCKKPSYWEIKQNDPLLKYLIVMHQNGKTIYKIPNKELYNNRHVVSLEFNDKEQLYAFCNDGNIFKIDILQLKAQMLEVTFVKLTVEGILKAKIFEKGFIALTEAGTIFHIKNMKNNDNNSIQFIVSLRDNLKFTNFDKCDFFPIPENESQSAQLELLIWNKEKEGMYLIKKSKESGTEFRIESRNENYSKLKINAFYINSDNVDSYNTAKSTIENENFQNSLNDSKKIGIISGIALSNSKKKIALYLAKKKTVYIFSTKISQNKKLSFEKYVFDIPDGPEDDDNDKNMVQKNNILDFVNKQLLFITDECVTICGGRWAIILSNKGTFVKELVSQKEKGDKKPEDPFIYSLGVSEVDGVRIMTGKEIYLIRKIPDDIKTIYEYYLDNASKQLLSSYDKYKAKDPFSNDELRSIKNKLPDAIFNIVKAAGYLYYSDSDPDTSDNKEVQSYFLKAANYGKSIFGKAEFNFDKFNNLLMNMRIINALRNFPKKPRFVTLEEYQCLISDSSDNIIKKTMRQLNFKLAFQITKFLGLPEKEIYLKFAVKKIKKIGLETEELANMVYDEVMLILKDLENISYIDIAKKCFKYNNYKLAEKFLANEKSSLVIIPQYLEMKNWNKAIELAIQSNDTNAVMVVLDNIYLVEKAELNSKDEVNKKFIDVVKNYPKIKNSVINYLKNLRNQNSKADLKDLVEYLKAIEDNEELFYFCLEEFFNSDSKEKREKNLKALKENKDMLKNDFYKKYVSDLESSLKFKKECLDKGIFSKNETTNFDKSIFDCFQTAISKPDNLEWITKQNNSHFKLSQRKLTILRFQELFKNKKYDEIERIVKEEGIKSLDISYIKIAMMFYEHGQKEKAKEYAEKETNSNLLEDKANLFIKMKDYEAAALTAIKIKDNDKFDEIFNIIGGRCNQDKQLMAKIQEIYNQRK